MSHNTIPRGAPTRRMSTLSLEVDVELCGDDRREATAEQLESLTTLLNAAEGVSLAAAEAHPRTNLVRVCLTVEADDLHEAHDRACTLVHEHVSRVGLAPAILVAARPARTLPAGRMMGSRTGCMVRPLDASRSTITTANAESAAADEHVARPDHDADEGDQERSGYPANGCN
jgi:hypothetical protein